MNKNLIIKIVLLLVILAGGQGVFWFFKTSAIKKHITAIVNSSDGNMAVSKVSVSGFPLSQKISIDDVKFQADAVADKIYLPNKYQVSIKHLEIAAGIFSNEFTAKIDGQVSLQDANGNVGYVEFKQPPSISFTSAQNKIQKLTYQDSGYKIVDEAKNTLYEGGNSQVEFTSTAMEENKVLNTVKADFNDLEGIDIFTTKKIMYLINPTAAVSAGEEGLKPVPANAPENVATPADAAKTPTTPEAAPAPVAPAISGLTKKAIHLEIEYVMAPKSEEAADKPSAPASASAANNLELASVNIKKLEFSSPLYKINVNGNFVSAAPSASSAVASCNMTVKVEKIENILTYVKTALASSKILPAATLPGATATAPAPTTTTTAAAPSSSPQNATTTDIAKAQQPEVDISVAITDLAKKNVSTTADLAVFDIKKEKDNDFMVNETPLIDLAKIFPAFAGDVANEGY